MKRRNEYLYRFGCSRDGSFGSVGNGGITVEVSLLFFDIGREKLMILNR
jgi:hypothetical protein